MSRSQILAGIALALAVPAHAETLTTDSILQLVAAGLPEEAIVAKIKSSGARFELTTDQMIALKQRGVTGPVIAAMLAPAQSADTAQSIDAADPMVPHVPGVYLAAIGRMEKIDATVSSQMRTGGLLGYAFTGGIASMSIKAAIQNATARVKAGSARPTFYFFFDASNGGSMSGNWLSALGASATSPSEFSLVRFMEKSGRREARVGSVNIGGAKTGVMDKDRLDFTYSTVRPGVYKVVIGRDLEPGEYGFLQSMPGGGASGAMSARIFDFSVGR